MYIGGNARVDLSSSNLAINALGLLATQTTGGVTLVAVTDSVISGNGTGIVSEAYNNGTARMSLIRVTVSNNGSAGIYNSAGVGGTAIMTVGSSMATGNSGTAFYNELAGGVAATFRSLGNNIVLDNGMDTFGPITTTPGI